MSIGFFKKGFEEIGVLSLHRSSLDVKLLCAQRFVRLFAYGASALIIAAYLSDLGNSDARVGLFMTLTLAGDLAISLLLTLFADKLGRRIVLALGSVLMAGSGVVFALNGDFVVLLAAAILGVISPSGNEIGPFRAIEESTLAHLTAAEARSDIFAWYSLFGNAGTALGIMTAGWVTNALKAKGWSSIPAYRTIFFLYAGIGILKFILTCAMSAKVEVDHVDKPQEPSEETEPLLVQNGAREAPKKKSLMPSIKKESWPLIGKLCFLFTLDCLGSGLTPLSWVSYFFKRKFDLPDGMLGTLFFTTNIIAACSMLLASSIAKRFGNIKTMVFTHMPSTIAHALIPFPSSAPLAVLFLVLRSCTQAMDIPPRSAFLAAVILPEERTAVMGLINVFKTGSQSIGPYITGILSTKDLFWLSFVISGALKLIYDLGILITFASHKKREESDLRRRNDGENET